MPTLADIELLFIDCQTTGASPAHGHLLEVGWAVGSASGGLHHVDSRLVRAPDDTPVPRRIQRMTGISAEAMADAVDEAEVWAALQVLAAQTDAAAVHYARFERAFLADLYARLAPEQAFPLELICTHQIARHLFADLPRRGIRAIAGYFGHVLGEHKRAGDHARATAVIWRHLVERLADCGVDDLATLTDWLADPSPPPEPGPRYAMPRERRLSLPDTPGVYRLLGRGGEILYVGKATSLRSRVNTYFQTRRGLSERKLELVTQIFDVDVTECATATEAALLEADAIKAHTPPYNQALRARHRRVVHLTEALVDPRPMPGPRWVVGPLVGAARLEPAAHLLAAVRAGSIEPLTLLPFADAVATEVLADGLATWQTTRGIDAGCEVEDLTWLGARLWRDREATALEDDVPADHDAEGDGDEALHEEHAEWTAELVCHAFDRIVDRLAWQLRRSLWLCRISEATVGWRRADGTDRQLVLRAGEVADARDLAAGAVEARAPLAVPPDWQRPIAARRAMDLATWDRLRVLTTELGRLVADGREVRLRFGPHTELDHHDVHTLLFWL